MTVIWNVGNIVAFALTGILQQKKDVSTASCPPKMSPHNPELNPGVPETSPRGWHGWRKLERVTVWFLGWNSNVTVSPTAALMFAGLYASVPFAPTVIL